MATQQLFLESLVNKPTWKEMLYGLIESKKLDPWNIDIVALSDGFLKKVKEMEKLDLMVPANVILAASILLRYKSQVLVVEEVRPVEAGYDEQSDYQPDDIPQLTLSARLMPKRQITLDELVVEMEKAMRYDTERPVKKKGQIDMIVELPVSGMDIEKKMDEVLIRLHELQDADGLVMFSHLANGSGILHSLLAVLHLAQKNHIDIRQDEFFKEIFIRIVDKGEAA